MNQTRPNKSSLDYLRHYRQKQTHYVIGIMSGTSFDGVDAALVQINSTLEGTIESIKLLGISSITYAEEFKQFLLRLCSPSTARIDDLVYGHFALSEWYAQAVNNLLTDLKMEGAIIDAICLHGQTVWHAPESRRFPGPGGTPIQVKGTFQIGSGPVLQERTGIPVLFDFRSRDMAAGGEGAPLAPLFDVLLFGHPQRGRIVQNIGGIGNATVIPSGGDRKEVFAFDTGPGNMIIDELVYRKTQGALFYDADGKFARNGKVDKGLLEFLLQDPYFRKTPPKSTGREVYGRDFVTKLIQEGTQRGLTYDDLIATATAFTAETMVRAYEAFIFPKVNIQDVIVGGGGALNPTLMERIRSRLPSHISLYKTDDLGVPSKAREAMAFALLGHEALMGRPGNIPSVTGASCEEILGCLVL